MLKHTLAVLGLAFTLLMPPAVSSPAHAININITIGSSLNHGRAITCSQGERLLRNRGFRDVRRIDCRGRFFVYRARRGDSRFEITLNSRTGRVDEFRRLRR